MDGITQKEGKKKSKDCHERLKMKPRRRKIPGSSCGHTRRRLNTERKKEDKKNTAQM